MSSNRIVILGSTGSIGTQTIDVLNRFPELGRVTALAANGSRPELLAEQVEQFQVKEIAIAQPEYEDAVQVALKDRGQDCVKVHVGQDSVAEFATRVTNPDDRVVNAMTGSVGLAPTLAALTTPARLLLANKESLVAGGKLVMAAARPGQLLPVDSEHAAIAQCLEGRDKSAVEALVITASGGPFRGYSAEQLRAVTPSQALSHPTWDMGRVITTNSASMVNKALEVIEAAWLFDLPLDQIEVVVHPQSIIHSMVRLVDGATLAQLSPPDMRHAIGWAMAYPEHLPHLAEPSRWSDPATWTFEPLDETVFPAIKIARAAYATGGVAMACYNAANEEAVDAFHAGKIAFPQIVELLAKVTTDPQLPTGEVTSVEQIMAAESWARAKAQELISLPATQW